MKLTDLTIIRESEFEGEARVEDVRDVERVDDDELNKASDSIFKQPAHKIDRDIGSRVDAGKDAATKTTVLYDLFVDKTANQKTQESQAPIPPARGEEIADFPIFIAQV